MFSLISSLSRSILLLIPANAPTILAGTLCGGTLYWIEQARKVIDAHSPDTVPFGRVKSDAGRIAAIERDRTDSQERTAADWLARGQHQARGVMDLAGIVDEFMVGHLEEHADQLHDLEK